MESRLLKLESTSSIERESSQLCMESRANLRDAQSLLVRSFVRASNNGEVTPTSVHAIEEKTIRCRSSTIHSNMFVE